MSDGRRDSPLRRRLRRWNPLAEHRVWDEDEIFVPAPEAFVVRLPEVRVGFQGIVYDAERIYLQGAMLRYGLLLLSLLDERIRWQRRRTFEFKPEKVQIPSLDGLRLHRRWRFSQWGYARLFTNPRWRWNPPPVREPVVESYSKLASIVQERGGYWHFTMETLPRLALVRDLLDRDPEIRLLVDIDFGGSTSAPWARQYLDLLGIDPARIVPYDPTRVYRARELYLPSLVPTDEPSREAVEAARRMVVPEPAPREERTQIIVVNRRDALNRRSGNVGDLVGALRARLPEAPVVEFVAPDRGGGGGGDCPHSEGSPATVDGRPLIGRG